LGRPEFQ
jgi:hypothetical protein